MTQAIEDLAAEEVARPVDPRKPFDMGQLLERAGKQHIRPRPLERCPLCEGRGHVPARFSFLWNHTCWGCGGWGAVEKVTEMYLAPYQPHPYKVLGAFESR